jgi:hypothetical protein
MSQGRCQHTVDWTFEEEPDHHRSKGQFIIESQYGINSKGSIELRDVEHSLIPEDMPNDYEAVVLSLQRSIPFEIFDPSDISITHLVILI